MIFVIGRVTVLFTVVVMVLWDQPRINADGMKAHLDREEVVFVGVMDVGNRVELTKQQHSQCECGQNGSAYSGKASHGVIPPCGIQLIYSGLTVCQCSCSVRIQRPHNQPLARRGATIPKPFGCTEGSR